MELDSSLSWLALTLTPGIAARLSARLLKEFGSPDEVFRAPLAAARSRQEAALQARRERVANLRKVATTRVINWTEPE